MAPKIEALFEPEEAELIQTQQETRNATASACVTLLAGVALIIVTALTLNSSAINAVDKVVMMDMGVFDRNVDQWSMQDWLFTSRRLAAVLMVLASLVCLTGGVGIVAAQSRIQWLGALTAVSVAVLSIIMCIFAFQVSQRNDLLQPVVTSQVDNLCNASVYAQMGLALRCAWAEEKTAIASCNSLCQYRVQTLNSTRFKGHGCDFLSGLCTDWTLQEEDPLQCLQSQADHPMFASSQDMEGCRQSCFADMVCNGFLVSTASEAKPNRCVLLQSGVSYQPPQWTSIPYAQVPDYPSGGTGQARCFHLDQSGVIGKSDAINFWLALAIWVIATCLLVNVAFKLCFLWDMHHGRADKPTGLQMALMMLLPCCFGHVARGGKPLLEEDERPDGEDEDYEEGQRGNFC